MAQPGRNDPCPCGSGKKFKRCCIDTYTTAQQGNKGPMTLDKLRTVIDKELFWENDLYRLQAHHFLKNAGPLYGPDMIYATVLLWQHFANNTMPIFKKLGAFSAALDYLTAYDAAIPCTQNDVAARYGVSAATVSKRFNELIEFSEDELTALEALDPPSARRPDTEALMRDIERLLAEQQFSTMEEAQAFINRYMQQQMNGLPTPKPRTTSKRDQAQDLLYEAMDEPSPAKRVKLARQALALDPDSPDAYVILGEEADGAEPSKAFFKQGVEAGERALGEPFFRENEGHFWGLIETRPYMRAKYNYAEACWETKDTAEARSQLEHLLKLNPMDNMGARYLLLAVYLDEGRLAEAEALLEEYDEQGAFFDYDRLILEYKKRGLTAKLKMLHRNALHSNRHIPQLLLGKKKPPAAMPDYYSAGDLNEAVYYVSTHAQLWLTLPELLLWMRDQK